MKFLYYLSNIFWLGLIGLVGTYFSNFILFEYLRYFGIFVFLYLALNFTLLKDSVLQIIGILKIQCAHKNEITPEAYQNDVLYSLPFDGKWVCVNGGMTEEFSHSWDIQTQRYAYDFIMLDSDNKSNTGDAKKMENYYCYGQEVLAPADGAVVKIMNRSDDSVLINKTKFIIRGNHIAGNYIIIRHSENEYSFLAHLKKNSFTVKEGDKVTRGQTVALCGNSGNSSEPHLHFHIQKGVSFYDSPGLPILFRNISKAKQEGYEKYDTRPCMSFEEIPAQRVTRGYSFSNEK